MLVNKIAFDRIFFQQRLGQPFEQGDIGADARLQIKRRNLVAAFEHRARTLGDREFDEARLLRRIDDDHITAAIAYRFEQMNEPGMIG